MPIKYLLIDDAKIAEIGPYADAVKKKGDGISIACQQPEAFEDMAASINKESWSGIILDLRLDGQKNEDGHKAKYTAQALAQELRTRMIKGSMTPVPIVLWSADGNIKNFFANDDTAQDLFDAIHQKDNDVKGASARVAAELISLANGYQIVSGALSHGKKASSVFHFLLGLKDSEQSILDPRIADTLNKEPRATVHETAHLILQELIKVPGPLIDERTFATRLGVDIETSGDWPKLLAKISSQISYRGVFSSAWPRWWATKLEQWWETSQKNKEPLRSLDAGARVMHLKKAMKFKKLKAAKPGEKGNSEKFWTICQATGEPLDPRDGLRASEPNREPWQDLSYLSVPSVLNRKAHAKGYRIHPLEHARFKEIQNR